MRTQSHRRRLEALAPSRPALEATPGVGLSRGRGDVRMAGASIDAFATVWCKAEKAAYALFVAAPAAGRECLCTVDFTSLLGFDAQPGPNGLESYIPTSPMEVNP